MKKILTVESVDLLTEAVNGYLDHHIGVCSNEHLRRMVVVLDQIRKAAGMEPSGLARTYLLDEEE